MCCSSVFTILHLFCLLEGRKERKGEGGGEREREKDRHTDKWMDKENESEKDRWIRGDKKQSDKEKGGQIWPK